MERIPAACAAIRRARTAALDIALEADMDGRAGIARALRRKVAAPRPGDWRIEHTTRAVVVTIAAHGVTATGKRHASAPTPAREDAARIARAATAIVKRERVRA